MASTGSPVPLDDLQRVTEASVRLLEAIEGISDADVRRASLLPGWTVGHVLTHVARNADSHVRRAQAAARGDIVEQYRGGMAGRAAEIDWGSTRTAAALRQDLSASASALAAVWETLPVAAWRRETIDVSGRRRPLQLLPARRWQELEVHVVDLDIGVTYRAWPDEFVAQHLPLLRPTLAGRLPPGAVAPELGSLDERQELAWLYGRLQRSDFPELTSWA